MSRCTCSSLALELFIKDLAGVHIRRSLRPYPRTSIRQQPRQRTFGTQRALRLPQAAVAERIGVEDGFVPFEFERGMSGRHDGKGSETKGPNAVGRDDGVEVDGEWHAEIEIAGEWPHRTSVIRAEQEVREDGAEGEGAVETIMAVEGTGVEDGAVAATPIATDSTIETVSKTPARPSKATSAPAVRVKSRAENRLERKQRRVQAGLWGIQKTSRQPEALEQAEQDEDAGALLERIEKTMDPQELEVLKTESEAKERSKGKKQMNANKDGNSGVDGKRKHAAKTKQMTKDTRGGKKSSPARLDQSLEEPRVREEPEEAAKAAQNTKGTIASKKGSQLQTETPQSKPKQEPWQVQKAALTSKFGDAGWNPNKKLSPDTMSGIRALHASDPAAYTTRTLSQHFEISPEAIRRILRSKWRPSEEEAEDRRMRWEKRGVKKWEDMAKKGIRPPKKWREMGVDWERKSRSSTLRSRGLGERGTKGGDAGMEEGVGMLNGINDEVEARID